MANLKRGADAERKCCQDLKAKGYLATRSAASKGIYDVIGISNEEILLIQVKRTKVKARRLFPKVVKQLKEALAPTAKCIRKQLWCWVDKDGWYIKDIE